MALEHGQKHVEGGADVRQGAVGVVVAVFAVGTDGGGEVAGFVAVEDALEVEDPPGDGGEVLHAGTMEFAAEQGDVLADQVVAAKVARGEEPGDLPGMRGEVREGGEASRADAQPGFHLGRKGDIGIEAPGPEGFAGIGVETSRCKFDETLGADIAPGAFGPDDGEGFVDFHGKHDGCSFP